jgi:hypothetical protein
MVLCLLPWPIRSHLAFPGEVAFYVATPERDVVIRCNPAKGANVFCLNRNNYEWLCGEVEGVYSAQVNLREYAIKTTDRLGVHRNGRRNEKRVHHIVKGWSLGCGRVGRRCLRGFNFTHLTHAL